MIRRIALLVALTGVLHADVVPSRAPTAQELRLVLSPATFITWSKIRGLDPNTNFKIGTTTNTENQSFRIKAEYEVHRPGEHLVLFLSDVEIYGTKGEAAAAFRGSISGFKKGLSRVKGASFEEKQALLTMGEQHYAAILKQDGAARGNYFVFTQGRLLHGMMIYGVVSTRHSQVRELLGPLYNESMRQFP